MYLRMRYSCLWNAEPRALQIKKLKYIVIRHRNTESYQLRSSVTSRLLVGFRL